MQKHEKITETPANAYSSESTRRELSNEYQHDMITLIFMILCFFVLWAIAAVTLEGMRHPVTSVIPT